MSTFLDKYTTPKAEAVPPAIPGWDFMMHRPLCRVNKEGELGIEIEMEGRNLPSGGDLAHIRTPTGNTWVTHIDPSLRGESSEYVTGAPFLVEETELLVNGLYDAFATKGSRLTPTNRCSTHVHVNMSGATINEVVAVFALWTMFEEILVRLHGENRTKNHHALTALDCPSNLQSFDTLLRRGLFQLNNGAKYMAINFKQIAEGDKGKTPFGTVEIRAGDAYNTPGPVIDWVRLCYGLVRTAVTTYNNPRLLVNHISELQPFEILREICETGGCSPNYFYHIVDNTAGQFERMAFRGFRLIQPLLVEFPWDDWVPQMNEPWEEPEPFYGDEDDEEEDFDEDDDEGH